jgi:hypothetical protein
VEDNLEVYLEKDKTGIEIEADDNLHAIISTDFRDNVCIYTSKEAIKYRKLIVRVTYTNDLKVSLKTRPL